MRLNRPICCVACLAAAVLISLVLLPGSASAQSTSGVQTAQTPSGGQAAPEETKIGDYVVTQSLEFGFRYTDVRGAKLPCTTSASGVCQDQSMYNTLVNLHTGPRLVEQTLALRSTTHTGALFDNLFVNSFGFGGDPNNVARLRINKAKAYNLIVNFRRDQSFFNYNLLANPLNVISGSPVPTGNTLLGFVSSTGQSGGFLVTQSPHNFSTVRRMTDVDLTIAPQSVVSLRLGYSRVRAEGPFGWTFHMPRGTEIGPAASADNTSDLYRAGVDFKLVPKTTISYDQFYTHYRVGISATDQNFFLAVGGVPTDLGLSWNPASSSPCGGRGPFLPSGAVNPACNQGLSYGLSNKFRTSIPTEQLSLQSHPSKWFDLSGRFMYSHSHEDGFFIHNWTGVTSTGAGQLITSGSQSKRDSAAADFGITFHLTDRLRLLDNFRWNNWRIPTLGLGNGTTFNPGTHPLPLVLTPAVPAALTGCTTAGPCLFPRFLKNEIKENQVSLEYDFTHAVGARIGYRYSDFFTLDRDETVPLTQNEFGATPAAGEVETGEDRASITGNTGLLGIWVRPSQKFRASFDGEITSYKQLTGGGNTGIPPNTTFGLGELTRITPRHERQFRVRTNYTPRHWAVVSGSLNILQQNNHLFSDSYEMHNYNTGIGIMLIPNDKYTFDLSYNYNSYLQNNFICPIGLVPGVPIGSTVLSTVCPYDINPTPPPLFTGLYQTFGRFESVNNFFSGLVRAKLVPRATVSLGYSISNNDGAQVFTNALLVPGSLKNNFHRPLAALEVELRKSVYAVAGWNYYDYNEKGPSGPTQVRDFHANTGMLSLRYAF